MSLHIYVAHTGEHLLADPVSFASPEALRSWIAQNASISPQRQILMTGRGKNVKIQTLLTEDEIFVYDKQYIAPPTSSQQPALPPDRPLPVSYTPSEPPSTLSSPDSLQAWQDLFRSRRTWALDVAERVSPMQDVIQEHIAQITIVNRAVSVAVDNLKSHVASMQARFAETRTWGKDALKDHKAAIDGWPGALNTLVRIPAKDEFTFLLRRPSTPTKRTSKDRGQDGTLRAFVDTADLEGAAAQASKSSKLFGKRLADVEQSLQDAASNADAAVEDVQNSPVEPLSEDEVGHLFEEAETFAKKINSDYEHILRLADNSKSIASVSRMALGHTRDFLPSLTAVTAEIDQAIKVCIQRRNAAVRSALHNMQNISVIESGLAGIQSQLQNLDLDADGSDAFDTLDLVFRLPVAYGSLLVESLKRHEWNEKVKVDSSSLAEEMAMYRDEEKRRRRKWLKRMADLIDETLDTSVTEMEVNLRGVSHEWPDVSRDDLNNYVEALNKHGVDDAYDEVVKMIKELDSPTRQQKKRAKAFKNGSVYDAGFGMGRSSLLLRGEDDLARTLKDENLKLNDKLKASDSRVRRLEAIIHTSGPMSRPLSGTFGLGPSEFERHVSSPLAPSSPKPNDNLSRRSSVSSRRLSSNHNPEERSLAARIVSLEGELMKERDTVSKLQQEAHAERRSSTQSRDRINEVESTKNDLMANLEAQRQEFEEERQLLEEESQKLKIRLEEAEDELDRIMGSRDQEKAVSELHIRDLQTQLDQTTKTSDRDREQAREDCLALQAELSRERERIGVLERQGQEHHREKSIIQSQNVELARQLRDAAAEKEDHISSLQAAHAQLAPGGPAPDDLGKLVRTIEILAEGLAIHARNSDDLAQLVSAENKQLEARIAETEANANRIQDAMTDRETENTRAREALAEESNKLNSLRSELINEQAELKTLREKFAAGETGSSAVRDQLAEEQRRISQLTEVLAGAEANKKSLEEEAQRWKVKLENAAETEGRLKAHLEGRGRRSKELSHRLHTQNDRVIRVMEQMGYSITRQDDSLLIQRASKVSSNSITLPPVANLETPSASTRKSAPPHLPEMPAPMNRSLSGAYPVQHYSDPADMDLLYWSDSDAASEDKKFQAFLGSLARLDLDAASELIAKRYKDVETLARKWQRDSRSYKEKYQRSYSDAHEKIAYRSFKEGDLALFLPTRNQATRPWAAFNVGAPHYFLREHDSHKLQSRDWLLARITKVDERVVDLSRSIHDRRSLQAETSDGESMRSVDDENPFELSDGLRWYMIDAFEEKPGAPTTPGLGKSTVAATNIDARGSIQLMKEKKKARDNTASGPAAMATKTLSKSLDSRRSSSGSKKGHSAGQSVSSAVGVPATTAESENHATSGPQSIIAETNQGNNPAREDAPIFEEDPGTSGNIRHVPSLTQGVSSTMPSSSSSPSKPRPLSPQKQKSRTWDRLWSMEYKSETLER